MKAHSRLFLFIAILALTLPALMPACDAGEPARSTSSDDSRPAEDAATGDASEDDAGAETPSVGLGSVGLSGGTNASGGVTATAESQATSTPPLANISAETDWEALVAFYNATGGPNWKNNEN